jgi:hypothetical protein
MKVNLYITEIKGLIVVSENPTTNSQHHYAIWKTPTVKLWERIQRDEDLVTQEKKAWEILLEDSSLGTDIQRIFNFKPGIIPKSLVSPLLNSTHLTTQELKQKESQALKLWGSSKTRREKYHPMLEKVSTAMVLAEKLGIPMFTNIEDLDIRTYNGIQHALSCYASVINLTEMQRRSRQLAINEAKRHGSY